MMNMIDISSWQKGLDLGALFGADNRLDGVIVKLTEGADYVNPEANAWITWLTLHKKPFGTYHFLSTAGAKTEARHYAEELKKWPGGVPAIDYEATALTKGTGYLLECLEEVYRLTGVKPLVYCSQSVTRTQDFSAIAAAGYRLWVAQYADMKEVHGFIGTPWQQGSVAPFDGYVMHQYTSCGRLTGWSRNLDFDQFRGGLEEWAALAAGDVTKPEPTPAPSEPKGPEPDLISEILHGKWGNGTERAANLAAAGYDAEAVQKKVNELYAIALTCKKKLAGNEEYLNSVCWIVRAL